MRTWPVALAVALLLMPVQPVPARESPRASDLGIYHTFDEMVSELENLTAAHPDILQMESIGKTYEGRDLWAVKLSDNVAADEAEPNITIFGGIHAGELIGVEVALYILGSLVANYTTDPATGWYVNSTQIWFVPMLNPDGHVYVEQGNQWRKNRSPNPGGTLGTDLNRNFGHLWGLEASHNPPDDDYCGPYAFSENETQAVDRLVRDHPPEITLSYHAFGQYILYPWGNSINQEPVDPRFSQIAWNMSFAMPEGRRYLPMYAREMYSATGDTDDWLYMNLSVLPFTVELATSNRPMDSAVPGICADNYGPVLYVLNYTAGAPPPPPPKRALSIEGPATFHGLPGTLAALDFTLSNTGELGENVSLTVSANSTIWDIPAIRWISKDKALLEPGENTTIRINIMIPGSVRAGEPAGFWLNATAKSGAFCSKSFQGSADIYHAISVSWFRDYPQISLVAPDVLTGNISIRNTGNVRENLTVSPTLSDGWLEFAPPGHFELDPGQDIIIPALVHVPPDILGFSTVNMTAFIEADGGFNKTYNITLYWIIPIFDMEFILGNRNVTLREKESVTVSVRIENRGNVWQNGTLDLSNATPFCYLDNYRFNISPGSNATANLTISGKKGSGSLNLTFVTKGVHVGDKVNYTIKANETGRTAPYDWTPVLLFVLILVVLAVCIALWWWLVEAPAERRRKDPP